MKINRLLAFAVGAAMIIGMTPAVVFADEAESSEPAETTVVESSEPSEKETPKVSETEPAQTKETVPEESSPEESKGEESTEDSAGKEPSASEDKSALPVKTAKKAKNASVVDSGQNEIRRLRKQPGQGDTDTVGRRAAAGPGSHAGDREIMRGKVYRPADGNAVGKCAAFRFRGDHGDLSEGAGRFSQPDDSGGGNPIVVCNQNAFHTIPFNGFPQGRSGDARTESPPDHAFPGSAGSVR